MTMPDNCADVGCLRIEKYGENTKAHRNPADCRAIHSEIDALVSCIEPPIEATIYITRYPCEACARAIVAARISAVVYGRAQEISDETRNILLAGRVTITHQKDFILSDTSI